jgi:hypothetical protein
VVKFFQFFGNFWEKTGDSLFFSKKSSHLQNKNLKEKKKTIFVTMPKIMIQSPF